MSRPPLPGDWPTRLGRSELIGRVGSATYQRGAAYALDGRVGEVSVAAQGSLVSASVLGSGRRRYEVLLSLADGAPASRWTGSCSCPVGSMCKHCVAVVLTAARLAQEEDASSHGLGSGQAWPGTRAHAHPADRLPWSKRLEAILAPGDQSAEVALEISPGRHRWGRFAVLTARPLLRGKRGGWIRTGISWRKILDGSLENQVDPAVLYPLRDIARLSTDALYYADDRLNLDTLPPTAWHMLMAAELGGLTLTTQQRGGQPVCILTGLVAGLRTQREKDGSVTISPLIDVSDVPEIATRPPRERDRVVGSLQPLGHPLAAYYYADASGALTLLPVSHLVSQGLSRYLREESGAITVPREQVAAFEENQLPQLVAFMPVDLDPTLHPAEPVLPAPPELVGTLTITDGPVVTLSWRIEYRSADGQVLHTIALPGPSAMAHQIPDTYPHRDVLAEEALLATAHQATRVTPWADRMLERAQSPHAQLDGAQAARFLSDVLPVLRERAEGVYRLEVVGDPSAYPEADREVVISTNVEDSSDPDWFSLRVRVHVGQEEVPLEALMQAIASGSREVMLASGAWLALDGQEEIYDLARLMEAGADLAEPGARSGELRVSAFQAGYYRQLVDLGAVGRTATRWQEGVARLLAMADRAQGESVADAGGAGSEPVGGSACGDGARAGSAGGAGTDAGADVADGAACVPLDAPVPAGLRAELRPYQLEGFRWLSLLRRAHLGGVLADDMGLGKTVQVLAAVQELVESRGSDEADQADGAPVLVIAPTSVISAWVEQAARFTPDLRVVALRSTSRKRGTSVAQAVAGAHVVVTTYALVRLDEEEMVAQPWSWVVADEAQFIKNRQAATYKAVRRLRSPSTLAITGTPLENSLMDLWSLMSVAAPGLLPEPERFAQVYRRPIDAGGEEGRIRLEMLRRQIRPFMLRRTKEQVALDLPAKTELVVPVELPAAHRKAYEARLSRERQKVLGLLEEDTARSRFSALRSLTILRQMALDPALLEADEDDGQDQVAAGKAGKEPTSGQAAGQASAQASGPDSGPASGQASDPAARRRRRVSAKVEVLRDTLAPIVAEGHKALVFSQFTRYLTSVRADLEAAGMRTAYLDGTTTDRAGVIEAFRAGEADVFLISLKAGGFGLTLTEADYVFLLDPWWNPQAEEQAVDRVHRIGQDKPVMVYRLVSAGTIEEKVMALKEKKADLFARVVEGASLGADAAAGLTQLTAQDIRDLMAG